MTLFKCFNKILRAPYLIIVRVRDMNGTWETSSELEVRYKCVSCVDGWRPVALPTAVIGSVKDMTWRGNSYSIRIKPVCHSHGGWTLCLSLETNASPTPPTRTRFSSWWHFNDNNNIIRCKIYFILKCYWYISVFSIWKSP